MVDTMMPKPKRFGLLRRPRVDGVSSIKNTHWPTAEMQAERLTGKVAILATPPALLSPQNQEFTHANIQEMLANSGAARALCAVPAKIIASRGLKFYKSQDPDDERIDEEAQKKWEDMQGDYLLERVITAARAHGWCLVRPKISLLGSEGFSYNVSPAVYEVITPDRIKHIDLDWDHDIVGYQLLKPPKPRMIKSQYAVGMGPQEGEYLQNWEIHHFEHLAQEDHMGTSVLEAGWEDLWYLEFQKYFAFKYDADQSEDVILLPVTPRTTDTQVSDQVSVLTDEATKAEGSRQLTRVVTYTSAGYAQGTGVSPPKPEMMGRGAASPQYTVHREDRFRDLAAGEGLTASQLSGSKPGVLHGAQEDAVGFQDTLRAIWQTFVPEVRAFCIRQEVISADWGGRLDVPLDLRMTAQEEADLELKTEQAIQLKLAYMSINEIRKLQGLKKLGPEYDELGDPTARVLERTVAQMNGEEGPQGEDPDARDRPPDEDLANSQNSRDNRDAARTRREDSFVIPLPAIRVDSASGLLVLEGPLLTAPDPLPYETGLEVRPAEEVEKYLQAPNRISEFYVGLDDLYPGPHPMEIPRHEAIGKAVYKGPGDNWQVLVDPESVTEMFTKARTEDWLTPLLATGGDVPVSVALTCQPMPVQSQTHKYEQRDLDLRSLVFTRNPRNAATRVRRLRDANHGT